MNSSRVLKEALVHGGMSRRDVNRWLGATGLALASMPAWGRGARAAGQKPMILEWSGYDIPELHPEYLAKHGESPDFSFFASQDEAFNKVRAGFNADLVHPCASQSWKWYDAGILKPIDTGRLSHWGNVFPTLQTMPGVRSPNDEVIMVPFDLGNSSFCYRTDLAGIDPNNESWTAILDPQYAGKLSVDQTEDNFRGVALAIGIKDVIRMTPDDLQQVKGALVKQKELVRFYWESVTDLAQAFRTGEIVISTCWNETSATLMREGIPVKMAHPKEGIITWVCGLVHLGAGSGDETLIYDFIDAFLDPNVGKFLINDYGYGHSNQESFKLVPQERLAELGFTGVDELMANSIMSGAGQDFDSQMTIITEVEAGV